MLERWFNRLIDNRVHATEVVCSQMPGTYFRKGDKILINGEPAKVWAIRNDADSVLLYRG
jgi:hypothetical protein